MSKQSNKASDKKCATYKSNNEMGNFWLNMGGETERESSYDPDSQLNPYNPDDLYQKKSSYAIYEEMDKDDQCNIAMNMKIDLILSSGFTIEPGDKGQEKIVDDIYTALMDDPETSFDSQLREVCSAYRYGFSISEKIFKKRPDGSFTFSELLTRHPNTWEIHQDSKGRVSKYIQRAKGNALEIKHNSLLHYVNNRQFGNPYGISDYRAAYNAYFTKKHIFRFWAIFLEKYASPVPVSKYDANAGPELRDELLAILKQFQQKSVAVIPKEAEIDFLETSNNGDVFIKAINLMNMMIGRSLAMPDLMGYTGGEAAGGSYALGETQMDIFHLHLEKRRTELERIVNKQIVHPLVVSNWGFIDNFPKFRIIPSREEDRKDFAKIWLDGIKTKAWEVTQEEVEAFLENIKMPHGEIVLSKQDEPEAPPNGFDSDEIENDDDSATDDEALRDPEDQGDEESEEDDKKKTFAKKKAVTPENRLNLPAIKRQLKAVDDKILIPAKPLIKEMISDIFRQLEKAKVIQKRNINLVQNLKFKNLKKINTIINRAFRDLYQVSGDMARDELYKAIFAKPVPLPADEFMKVLEDETFEAIGDWKMTGLKSIRAEITAAIKDGATIESVVPVLSGKLEDQFAVSLERWSRTKATEVMNKGRLAFFNSTGDVAAYKYSAILDGRTTEICLGLHDKVFAAGTEPKPPLHFNCRSLLIPLTRFDDFEIDKEAGGDIVIGSAVNDTQETVKIKKEPIDKFISDRLEGTGFSRN